jgi:hypothetical protein
VDLHHDAACRMGFILTAAILADPGHGEWRERGGPFNQRMPRA